MLTQINRAARKLLGACGLSDQSTLLDSEAPIVIRLDHAGVHHAGIALAGKAADQDAALSLAQIASVIPLADRIVIHGFDVEHVNDQTREVLGALCKHASSLSEVLCLGGEPDGMYAEVVQRAADMMARGPAIPGGGAQVSSAGARPAISSDQQRAEDELEGLLRDGCGSDRRSNLAATAIAEGIVQSPAAMVLVNDVLFNRYVGKIPVTWSTADTRALVTTSRFYFNLASSALRHDTYVPSLARAKRIHAETMLVLRWIDSEIAACRGRSDDSVFVGSPMPLPTFAQAIVMASHGEIDAMFRIAGELQLALAPLRVQIAKYSTPNGWSSAERQQVHEEIAQITRRCIGRMPTRRFEHLPTAVYIGAHASLHGVSAGLGVHRTLYETRAALPSDFLLSELASNFDSGFGEAGRSFAKLVARTCCNAAA